MRPYHLRARALFCGAAQGKVDTRLSDSQDSAITCRPQDKSPNTALQLTSALVRISDSSRMSREVRKVPGARGMQHVNFVRKCPAAEPGK